jgi:hypothetical protein
MVAEHNEKLQWVHDQLKSERLYISRKKFELFAPVLDILGCKVDGHGVHADSDKMAKLHAWREPSNHREVLHFLGLIEYLAWFMPNVSAYTGPLQTICTNNLPFFWSPLHQKCFNEIKNLVCKMPILKPIIWQMPDDLSEEERCKLRVWVITDACPAGIGAILAQGASWELSRPAAFMSLRLNAHTLHMNWKLLEF